jgi:hypothetical protein
MIVLVDITYFDGATESVLRYSSEPYADGDTYYEPALEGEALPTIEQDLQFPTGERAGKSNTTSGIIRVPNADGTLDAYLNEDAFGFDGRDITIKIVVDGTVTTLLAAKQDQPDKDDDYVYFKITDKSAILDKPLQTTRYAGDNALPDGVEGNEDLKGSPKPILIGDQQNIPGTPVNQSKLIWQVSDDAVADVTAALHLGVGFAQESDYADLADMYANQPSRASYRVLKTATGSYVRFGSSPVGRPLFDAISGANVAARTPGQGIVSLLEDRAGFTTDDYQVSDITALDVAQSGVTGFWSGLNDLDIADAINIPARAAGAWWGFNRLGKFRIQQFVNPTGQTPTITLRYRPSELGAGEYEMLGLSWKPNIRIPAYRTILSYQSMVEPETRFASVVSQSRRDLRGKKYREVYSENTTIYNPATRTGLHLNSEPVEVMADFRSATVAQAEADRRLTLWSARQDVFMASLDLTPELLSQIDIGTVALVYVDRYGYTPGKNVIITGIRIRLAAGVVEIQGYGFGTGLAATAGGGAGSGTADNTPTAAEFDVGSNTWYSASNPTVNDDVSIGVRAGHVWVNETSDRSYVCSDDTDGAAVWVSVAKTFSQTTTPTDALDGDLWFDTDDGNHPYRYNGSSWVSQRDGTIATASATADGKNTIFAQNSAPTANETNDLWVDTNDSDKVYIWNGSSWVANSVGGGTIVTGSTPGAAIATAGLTFTQLSSNSATNAATDDDAASNIGTSPVTVCSTSITTQGGPTVVIFTAVAAVITAWGPVGAGGGLSSRRMTGQVYKSGVLQTSRQIINLFDSRPLATATISVALVTYQGAGTYTFDFRAFTNFATDYQLQNSFLQVVELRR